MFAYEPIEEDTVNRHANQAVGSYDSYIDTKFQQFRVHDGDNNIRILHRTFDAVALGVDKHWGFPVAIHYGIGPDEAAYLCRKEMLGESCCLCDERLSMAAADPEEAKKLKPNRRYLVWLIDRKSESEGPKLWAMPGTVEKQVAILSRTNKGAVIQVSDPNNGYDISFRPEGEPQFRKYGAIAISREASPLSDDPALAKKWVDYITQNPLDKVLRWYEDSYVQQVRGGAAEPVDELDPQPAAAPPVRGGRIRSAAAEPVPAVEEELPFEETPADQPAEEDMPPAAEDVLAMDEDGLNEVIQRFGLEIDMNAIATVEDLAEAVNAMLDQFYGEGAAAEPEPEPEPEPAPPPPPPTRRRVAAPAAAKPAGRLPAARPGAAPTAARPRTAAAQSPVEQAASRLQGLKPRDK